MCCADLHATDPKRKAFRSSLTQTHSLVSILQIFGAGLVNFVFIKWLGPTYAGKNIRDICLKFSQPASRPCIFSREPREKTAGR